MVPKNRNNVPTPVDFTLISKALVIISGKWRLTIILLIGEDTFRFRQFREQLPSMSEKMLAGELKALVALDVLTRTVYAEVPPRVEYSLTKKGRLALPILRQLQQVGHLFN
ncbi:winged helix-turn-helix transcriptional regulator [Larkinella terrae]|uniref:Transcriptional regulator n=1 Tax=Larkinella terrae TaxID=2025311 RepID=A0A7K0EJG0_9BACT|nr:helix-turn-helix domain-containing protein [Larkinella terrae]MRS61661.1 transcriptional regulator [Larkinella terrae]